MIDFYGNQERRRAMHTRGSRQATSPPSQIMVWPLSRGSNNLVAYSLESQSLRSVANCLTGDALALKLIDAGFGGRGCLRAAYQVAKHPSAVH